MRVCVRADSLYLSYSAPMLLFSATVPFSHNGALKILIGINLRGVADVWELAH